MILICGNLGGVCWEFFIAARIWFTSAWTTGIPLQGPWQLPYLPLALNSTVISVEMKLQYFGFWFPQREDKGWWGLGVSSLISENPEVPFSGIFYLVSGSFEVGPLRVSGLPYSQEQKSELSILYVTQIRQHLGSPGKS